uniref:Uncharacterized protein n=1 Tax=Rhizophora mucronata TaxID=61149 RepID=A0A2P2Q6G5_RHIMU
MWWKVTSKYNSTSFRSFSRFSPLFSSLSGTSLLSYFVNCYLLVVPWLNQ